MFLCATETGLALFPVRAKDQATADSGGISVMHIALQAERATFEATHRELADQARMASCIRSACTIQTEIAP